MKRYFFLGSLLLCFFNVASIYAQDNIPLRTSARDGYSRLTLGWKDAVKYSLNKDDGLLTIKFDRAATVDTTKVDLSVLDNISEIKVISTNPLTLSINIPKTSNIRDIAIGKRIILDVYDPIGGHKNKVESSKKPENKKSEVKTTPSAYAAKLNNIKKSEDKGKAAKAKPAPKNVEKRVASPPAFVLVPENLPEIPVVKKSPKPKEKKTESPQEKEIKQNKKKLSKAVKEDHHVISLRATKSLDMAVFEEYGELRLIMGSSSSYVLPTLNSPTPDIFSSLDLESIDGVVSYRMSLPEQPLKIKAKGGGLIWDIILGSKVKEGRAAKPFRSVANSPDSHGERIIWPLEQVHEIVDFVDPITGGGLKAVLVEDASQFTGAAASYVDFDVLKSPVGMVIRPKVDDLNVEMTTQGIAIYRKSGLNLSNVNDAEEARIFAERLNKKESEPKDNGKDPKAAKKVKKNFFQFKEWQLGKAKDIAKNESILLSGMKGKSESRRIEDLLSLGKMYLSHGFGAEALGFFNFAGNELPALLESPEFVALRGVAKALDWKSDAALEDFLFERLENEDEVKYWKSFVLADLGDWQQAAKTLPEHYKAIHSYPKKIGHRLALSLAEVNLRDGNLKAAEELMALVEKNKSSLSPSLKASLKYLRGESYRQKKQKDKTKKIWKALTKDQDDLYRTKAGLALTILLAKDDKITNDEAIDRLERLRYAWRGDELEAQVQYWLGDAYFKDKKFIKGLSIMRDAAAIAGDSALGQRIAGFMGKTFTDLFLGEDLKKISAVDAVSLYDTFSELTPVGETGDKLVQNLAEHLVNSDLLGRATKLLNHQVSHRLDGMNKLRVAIRLAAIELINKSPQKAMNALGKASDTLHFLSDTPEKAKYKSEIDLLKIRAYSQNKQFKKAMSLLDNTDPSKNVNRLRADIAWQAGYWDEAAESLNSVLSDENISMTRPLSQEQSDLILNRAIALSLSNDRIALGNMRAKYSDLMLQTHKAHQFEVITRPRQNSALADRETLLSVVSEVDLFKDFLDSYRSSSP
ncbi:MAG: hypothetical protein ACRBB3_05285 [Alphaproteobacteria bacterium]